MEKEDSKQTKSGEKNLLETLTVAVQDLIYISETDAPFEAFSWKPEAGAAAISAVNADVVLRRTDHAPDAPIRERSLESFFRFPATVQEWHEPEEAEVARRYQKLQKVLEENLTDAKVFKIGTVEIDVYIIGIDAAGNLTGVKTKGVET